MGEWVSTLTECGESSVCGCLCHNNKTHIAIRHLVHQQLSQAVPDVHGFSISLNKIVRYCQVWSFYPRFWRSMYASMSKVTQRERLSSILAFLSSRNRLKTRTSFRKQNTRSFSARQPKEGPAVAALSTTPKATFEGFVSFFSSHIAHETFADYLSMQRQIDRDTTRFFDQPRPNHCTCHRPRSPILDYSLVT